MRLKDKVVLVTGATSGIGLATARLCAREGARVVGTGRDQARLATLAKDVELALTMDVTDETSVAVATTAMLDRFGHVDAVVNNAGVGLFKSWAETTDADLRQLLEVNFFGAVRVATRLLPTLIERKGVLVQVASVAGRRGYARHAAYCASKHALIGWSEAVRRDLSGTGASMVVVCPPAIDTPFFANAGYRDFRKDHEGLRLLTADRVASAILCSLLSRPRTVLMTSRSRMLDTMNFLAPNLLDMVQRFR